MSKVKPIPDGYHTVTPYLVVEGASKLIDFLKQAFGAEERFRFADPNGTIHHAEVKIGDSIVMLGDANDEHKPTHCSICLYMKDTDAVYKSAVQAGGVSLREPADQFYGDRTAGVKDPAGNQWWISTHIEDVSPEELTRRAKAQGK